MTKKWLCLTPNPPHVFYTLTKIHKPTPVGRPIISGCGGPTERLSSFVDRLLQPIAQKQKSYLKDTTDQPHRNNKSAEKCNPCLNGRD